MDLLQDKEFQKVLQAIANEVGNALNETMENARNTLKKHIDEDVYSESIYSPKVYKRRSDNSSFGISLGSQVYQSPFARVIPPAASMVGRKFMVQSRLYFNPSGEHKVKKWNTAGDGLIGRIERKDPAYTWGQNKVPSRPFWQKFIDEMIDGGEFEKSFVKAMKASEIIRSDGNVTEDPYDRET